MSEGIEFDQLLSRFSDLPDTPLHRVKSIKCGIACKGGFWPALAFG
jgi:hypothetical protein